MWLVLRPALTKAAAVAGPALAKWVVTQGLPSLRRYNAAAAQARAVGGYVGVWVEDDGKHWVVLDADRREIVGTFPPMSRAATQRALDHLDRDGLVHHEDVLLRRLSARARALPARVRQLPPRPRGGRRGRD